MSSTIKELQGLKTVEVDAGKVLAGRTRVVRSLAMRSRVRLRRSRIKIIFSMRAVGTSWFG
jgi:hypothetical protein